MRNIITIVGLLGYLLSNVSAQNQETLSVSQSKLINHGKTKKLSTLMELPVSAPEKKEQYKKDKLAPNNFFNRPERKVARPDLEHQGPDLLRKLGRSASSTAELEVFTNNNALSNGSVFPLDPTGSIGLEYYLQAINATIIGVYRKDGSILGSFSGNTLWSDLNLTSRGDPIIMYDQELSRWIITEFTRPASLLIAVSETTDPLGSYYTYEFVAPNFPDYPKYGIWNDHFVVTTNEQGPGQLHNYFIDRHALMSGAEEVAFQRASVNGVPGFQIESPILITVPVDWEGQLKPTDPRPMILRLNDSSWGQSLEDGINIYQYNVDYDNPNNTDFELTFIPTSPYDGYPCWGDATFSCLPQRDGDYIAAIPETIMNTVQYRNFGTHEAVVLAFITDVTNGNNHSGIRWIELRKNNADEPWYLFQEGTYSPDDELHRFMPSIAIDRLGCISIAYSVTSENDFVGLRMTGRCPDDPPGEMTVPEYSIANGGSALETEGNAQNGNRYGDYSHLSVDPKDELTMWFTAEYAGGGNRSITRLISYRLTRDSVDIGMNGLVNQESGVGFTETEEIEVSITNFGKTDIPNYKIGYMVNGIEMENVQINDTIASKEEVLHTFSVPADLSERGEYEITTYVNYISDLVVTNDTTRTTIIHYNDHDVAINLIPMFSDCGISREFELEITNLGAITIDSAIVEILYNGAPVDTLYTEDSFSEILFFDSKNIPYFFEHEVEDENILEARVTNLFTNEDSDPSNNISRYQFEKDFLSLQVILTIALDNSPNETTWEVVDQETGVITASGGPYLGGEGVTIEEKFCVNPDKCYVFTMFDAGGDGICCGNGFGIYNVSLFEEGVLFNGNTFFASEDVHSFCPGNPDCSLIADFNVGYESSSDLGSILITANSGIGPYSYSIDGGETFQEENLFIDLPSGEYNIIVLDADGFCSYTETVTISLETNTTDLLINDLSILVKPNPTDGFFNVEIHGYKGSENWFTFQILDNTGKLVQERKILKYDDIFMTQVSLLAYPDGLYYFRIVNDQNNQLTRIIKQ